jgi:hypothetical protein
MDLNVIRTSCVERKYSYVFVQDLSSSGDSLHREIFSVLNTDKCHFVHDYNLRD